MTPDFDKTCFVIMPFGDLEKKDDKCLHFLAVYENIKKAIDNSGVDLICLRADKINKSGDVNEDIIKRLHNSKMVIADLSDRNPNVFYELGVRHSLMQNTILIAKAGTKLPFDTQGQRTIPYKNQLESFDEIELLTNYIIENMGDSNHKDSPVMKVLGSNIVPKVSDFVDVDIVEKLNKSTINIAYKHITSDQYFISCLMTIDSIKSHIVPIEDFNDIVFKSFDSYRNKRPNTRFHCKSPTSYLNGVCFEFVLGHTKIWMDFNAFGAVNFEIIANKYGEPPRLLDIEYLVDVLMSIMKLGESFFNTLNYNGKLKINTLLDKISKVPLIHRDFESYLPFSEITTYEDNYPFVSENIYKQDEFLIKTHIKDILKIILRLHNFDGNPTEFINMIYDNVKIKQKVR